MRGLIKLLADAYTLVIIVRVILTWIQHDPYNPLIKFIYQITEPPLKEIRKYVPNLGGLDISPMILIFAVIILQRILMSVF